MSATLDDVHTLLLEVHEETRALRLLIEARAAGPIASDADVDGERGNPVAKFDPKTWKGPTFRGKKYTECPADFLDHLAAALTSIAAKEDSEKKLYKGRPASGYSRQAAARARRWAYRKRLGWTPPEAAASALSEASAASAPFGGDAPLTNGSNPFAPPPAEAAPSSDPEVSDDELRDGADEDLRDPVDDDVGEDEMRGRM